MNRLFANCVLFAGLAVNTPAIAQQGGAAAQSATNRSDIESGRPVLQH